MSDIEPDERTVVIEHAVTCSISKVGRLAGDVFIHAHTEMLPAERAADMLWAVPERPASGDTATASDDPSRDPAQRLHELRLIGRGGFGLVHASHDSVLLRTVAKKTLDRQLRVPASSVLRFVEEAQITAQLDHPNIVPVYDFAIDNEGRQYFTMKLIKGHTLTQELRRLEQTTDSRVLTDILQIFIKVCDAIAFAHSKGVVHRDLKPDNVMVGAFGQVYVMDWGIAHLVEGNRPSEESLPDNNDAVTLTRTPERAAEVSDIIVGSLSYMAPEQAYGLNKLVDGRTDVFSLGAILYQIITGRPPYLGHNVEEVLHAAKVGKVEHPDEVHPGHGMPASLVRIAMKAMKKDRRERYQSVDELKDAIAAFLRGGLSFVTRNYAEGAELVREGDAAHEAFIMVSGQCEVTRSTPAGVQLLRRLKPGDVFGEAAILTDQPRTASVRALSDVTVTVVGKESLEAELGADSWVGLLVKALATRFLDLDAELAQRQSAELARHLRAIVNEFLCWEGVRDTAGMRGPWSACLAMVRGRLGIDDAQVIDMLGKEEDITLDLANDALVLRRSES